MQGVLALMQSRDIPQEPIYLLDRKAPCRYNVRLNRICRIVDSSGDTITQSRKKEGISKSNGFVEQEKGVNMVWFQDGIAQVLRIPWQGYARHHQDFYRHLL
jgi:hypothetical protein